MALTRIEHDDFVLQVSCGGFPWGQSPQVSQCTARLAAFPVSGGHAGGVTGGG